LREQVGSAARLIEKTLGVLAAYESRAASGEVYTHTGLVLLWRLAASELVKYLEQAGDLCRIRRPSKLIIADGAVNPAWR